MAGTVFLQAQYLQFVLEYTPLASGFALVPAAIGMLLGTGAGAHLAEMHGGRVTVTTGTLLAAAGVAVQAGFVVGALGSAMLNLPDVLPPRRMFALAAVAARENGETAFRVGAARGRPEPRIAHK